MPRKTTEFLLLDKDNILNICGRITFKELQKALNANRSTVQRFIDFGRIFEGKYIIVEDE